MVVQMEKSMDKRKCDPPSRSLTLVENEKYQSQG